MKKQITILVGIPCSGKSFWIVDYVKDKSLGDFVILSRDIFRKYYFGSNYKQNQKGELFISLKYNEELEKWLFKSDVKEIILDNTHCNEKYLNKIINEYCVSYQIKIIKFDCFLFKAYYRNIIRYFKYGRWVPFKIINSMYKNYKNINFNKYNKFLWKK